MQQKHSTKRTKQKKPKTINTLPIYVFLLICLILYIYFEANKILSIVFGAFLFFAIIILLVIETINGIREEGYLKNIIEVAIAIIVVVIFWFSLKALLHTNYPLDVVPSCSMLPSLKRGDLVVLQGIRNISRIKAPMVSVTSNEYQNMISNISKEALSCVAYNISNGRVQISQFLKPGYSIGLYSSSAFGGGIVPQDAQDNNLIKYTCGTANLLLQNGSIQEEAYTTSITISGTVVTGDKNNSIVVYQTIPQDIFYKQGDSYIVHRVYAIINVSGSYYILTKGDNNPGLDIQFNNYPANLSLVQGKVIVSIPYLGYLKLILSSNFNQPYGCNFVTLN